MERGDLQTSSASMCGECSQWMDRTGFHSAQGGMSFPRPTLLWPQGALPVLWPVWALCFTPFPGLSCSGSWELREGTDPHVLCVFCPSQVQAAGHLVGDLSQVDRVSWAPLWSWLPGFSLIKNNIQITYTHTHIYEVAAFSLNTPCR